MCFYCILYGLVCIGEGTKTWVHSREQAILSGQFLGYMCSLVFSEKRKFLTFFFFFAFFCRTMGVLLEYTNSKTNILPFSLLRSGKYDEFCSLINVGKSRGVTPMAGVYGPSTARTGTLTVTILLG